MCQKWPFNKKLIFLLVQDNQPTRETGVHIRGPGELRVREGQTVTLECDTEGSVSKKVKL